MKNIFVNLSLRVISLILFFYTAGESSEILLAQLERQLPITNLSVLTTAGYIIPEDKPRGSIIGSLTDKIISGGGDKVYIDIGKSSAVLEEDRFTIYRSLKEVRHPITRERLGFLIEILGEVEVLEVQKNISTAQIKRSYGVIETGNKIREYEEIIIPTEDPFREKKNKNISGYIVEMKNVRRSGGEGDILYIDKGSENGVSPGDIFSVFRLSQTQKKLSPETNQSLPKEVIGQIKVINVRARTSTALIIRNNVEILIGEKIESE